MAASSSATRMLPAGMIFSSGRAGRLSAGEHGHQNAEDRVPGLRFALDDAAVVADDLRHQREAEAGSGRLRGHEWVEQMRHQVFWHARTIVLDAELERQRDARLD